MNEEIIKQIATKLNIKGEQVSKTLAMLEEGNTIPLLQDIEKK